MHYCNYSFLIEKGSFNECMAVPGVAELNQYQERGNDYKCLQLKHGSLEKSRSLQVASWNSEAAGAPMKYQQV